MKNIIFCGYREWAYKILEHAITHAKLRGDVALTDLIFTGEDPSSRFLYSEIKTHFFDGKNRLIYENVVNASNAELIIFAGWSWMVPKEITDTVCCICIHPSDLPNFAGGSPLQNQVLAGVVESMLTVFRMDAGIDTGPVYKKTSISLLGPIEEVLDKISLAGLPIIRDLISDFANNELIFNPQNYFDIKYESHSRRTPADSVYTLENIRAMPFSVFQKTVDVLRSPYPNLSVAVGERQIEIKQAFKVKYRPVDMFELNNNLLKPRCGDPFFISLKDGFAVIVDYRIL